MVNTNAKALGIIFPNSYDKLVPELVSERLMGSIPFAGRYRMIDFVLSSMVNSGISNISVLPRSNYMSLMDHLGSGREWDLARKNGGLNIVPPFAERDVKIYSGRVDAIASILPFLREQKEKYVVMSDAHIAMNLDFKALLEAHIASGAEVTVVYAEDKIPQISNQIQPGMKGYYYSITTDENNRVTKIKVNSEKEAVTNLSMNVYVMEREALIERIHTAFVRGNIYFERDILASNLDEIYVNGYKYEGYRARIHSVKDYFDENMKLLEDENLDALFGPSTIYTKIRDDNPTRYIAGSKVKNTMAADGCVIEGEVENCVLFRGVKVGKGAKVKNCVLMQDTVVEAGASLEYVISDKNAVITEGKELKGTDTLQVFIEKGKTV